MSDTSKGTEKTTNEEGGDQEVIVNTVDHRTYPGLQGQPERSTTENIQVIHQTHPIDQSSSASSGGIGMLAGAAASVANTARSAKEAISSSISTDDKK
ncbi:hypothetical protein BVC80_8963g36 [Macleaya cordata]|uniref:Uncharacterized protein n=1 Tax=Macleaya cordata TaxID=56857 RepID=A0A200PV41_MACCD|nr:hypothetical protein BVC80_8963g36 [Macleaya cordata]